MLIAIPKMQIKAFCRFCRFCNMILVFIASSLPMTCRLCSVAIFRFFRVERWTILVFDDFVKLSIFKNTEN